MSDSIRVYDICIIGAGPAGSACAYYASEKNLNVLLLEKEKFPRPKTCGDAISQRAQMHLERMGVLQEILDEKKGNWAASGGLVSPGGISFIGDSAAEIGSHLMIAIKRKIMDEKMAHAAADKGAHLIENSPIKEYKFSKDENLWIIKSGIDDNATYKSRVLVAADGASSLIARSLNIINNKAEAICSSVYIKAGTHSFHEDGVVYYPLDLLPGYAAIFKEADGDLVFCCYIIPGGKCSPKDLKTMHYKLLNENPFIKDAIGIKAEIEDIKSAPLRLGGIKKSYSDNVLIIGDAAGHIDPLTGEGIQYAMDSGELAAITLEEAFNKNDFSEKILKRYHKRWMKSFGNDFKWSSIMVKTMGKFPIFLDAFAYLANKKGTQYMIEWAKIMTGSKSKLSFFMPSLLMPLLKAAITLKFKRTK